MQIKSKFGRLATGMFVSAALTFGASAHAQPNAPAKVELASAKAPSAKDEKKICITESKLGSRLSRKVCRTQAEWDLEQQSRNEKGFDPHQRF